MDVINAIIKPVVDTLMVPVKRHLGYMINCTKYVRDMHYKLSELNSAKIGVEDHIQQNTSSLLEVPAQVRGWLEDVRKINAKVEDMPSDVGTCFSLKLRHRVGRKAFKLIEEVESVTRKHSLIIWTDHPIPLGKVDSMKESVSTPSTDHDDFKSREQIFTEALQALHPNHKSHMIALCGMGGVGKTTMMQRLKKVVQEKKMFDFIIEAVIGHKTDPIAIQEAVADYLSIELNEKTKSARADKLRKMFVAKSDGGKNKFLVILDDVWQFVDLNDIGLSPLPNEGVDFKVLLTSRDVDVCTMMGVEANSILNMKILLDGEAQSLFHEFVKISSDVDPKLHKMGEDIVRKCCGLPIAIKTMALTLRNKSKDAWSDALSRLEHHDFHDFVNEVFGISYDYLQDQETKSIFLLCGLFPEDYNIPPEELVRYGWGLNLFKKVYTIREARARLNTCIERLIHTNLLMEGDVVGCVKMHDLALAFVMDMFSKVHDASIVNHGSMSGWPENDVSGSCQRISLTCKGMSGFPIDLNFPNLSILKLMHGDKFLKFPPDFYEQMEKLQVVSFHEMKYPFLPSSPQCSTNLRVLHLHQCSLMFDCSCIGNLFNLEVLSFANSGIEWLPSRIGNLKKLRLLDLTDCFGLRIDKGVLKNLVKLEEVYMRVAIRNKNSTYKNARNRKAISFTDDNCNEMAELSKNLSALEFEFFENNAQPKNMSFEKLERFKISMGSELSADHLISSRHSFENTLRLVTKKGELLESRMNELFQKTEVLYLSVRDMNHLEDVEVKSLHPPQSSSFYNLRVLVVSDCAELRYLFTLSVAKALSKLEHLKVSYCRNMEELIHTGGNGEEKITFPKLKFLYLRTLSKLSGLCDNVNIIELPQLLELELFYIRNITSIYHKNNSETSCLLNEEVEIPKLEKLSVHGMNNLKEIWPCEYRMSGEVKLREIKVDSCDNLVNLFPCNPMPLLRYLEELEVKNCKSVEVLFNIDLDCVDGVGVDCGSSNLRSIVASQLGNLREVWRVKTENNSHHLVRGFQAVESISIGSCERFRHVFTPTATNFDLGALIKVSLSYYGKKQRKKESMESDKQINILSKEEMSRVGDSISNIFRFPSGLANSFRNLRMLQLRSIEGVEVVFEIESPTSTELVTTQPILPNLQELDLCYMDNMSHVWKCNNWNKFFILHKQHSESPFHNLTTIKLEYCRSIKYLFSPLMGKLLSNLKKIEIQQCNRIEEVVSNRDDEDEEKTTFTSTSTHTNTILFPRLDSLALNRLDSLKYIGGSVCANGGNNEISSNNSTTTTAFVDQFKSSQVGDVSWALCQYSRVITIQMCYKLSSVIPSYAAGQMQKLEKLTIENCSGMKEIFETQGISNNNSGSEEGNGDTPAIPRLNNGCMLQLVNLKELNIHSADHLEYVFPYSALESLGKLEGLWIRYCSAMKVIVKKEEDDGEQQTIRTEGASSNEVVVFPRLKSIRLSNLPCLMGFFLGMNEFTYGWSTAPQLKYIDTSLGKHSLEYGLINIQFPNLKILSITACDRLEHIFKFSAIASLKQLEELNIFNCKSMKVIVKKEEEDASSSSSSSSSKEVLVFPRLKSIELLGLPELVGFFLGTNELQLPLLDDVVIKKCPQMVVFTSGQLTALKLKHVQTGVGTYSLECGLNFHVSTTVHHQNLFQSSNITSSSPATTKGGVPWSYQNLIKLHVSRYMETPKKLFPCNELLQLQNLEMIRVWRCNMVEEVFEALQGTNSGSAAASQTTLVKLPNLTQVELEGLMNLRYIWRSNQWTVFELPNLTKVEIIECSRLEHVFTSPMVGSLLHLQDLTVRNCKRMEEVISKDANVVVEEEQEESNAKRNEIVLPCLRSLTLSLLPCLKGFSLGNEDFSFPLLDTLRIKKCPTITIFTKGNSATPQLKEIETSFHLFHAGEDINSFIKIRKQFIQQELR